MRNQILYTTCGLACLEGVLADLGIPQSQEMMLVQNKKELLVGVSKPWEFGALNRLNVQVLAQKIGFKVQFVKDHEKGSITARYSQPITERGVILGYTIGGFNHMAKFERREGNVLVVSEPNFSRDTAEEKRYSLDEMISFDFEDWHIVR
jgi:hypothetical protein